MSLRLESSWHLVILSSSYVWAKATYNTSILFLCTCSCWESRRQQRFCTSYILSFTLFFTHTHIISLDLFSSLFNHFYILAIIITCWQSKTRKFFFNIPNFSSKGHTDTHDVCLPKNVVTEVYTRYIVILQHNKWWLQLFFY